MYINGLFSIQWHALSCTNLTMWFIVCCTLSIPDGNSNRLSTSSKWPDDIRPLDDSQLICTHAPLPSAFEWWICISGIHALPSRLSLKNPFSHSWKHSVWSRRFVSLYVIKNIITETQLPWQNPVWTLAYTNSVFTHSCKQPTPVADTSSASQGCPLRGASTVFKKNYQGCEQRWKLFPYSNHYKDFYCTYIQCFKCQRKSTPSFLWVSISNV